MNDPFEKYDDVEVKHLQVVYLAYLGFAKEKIAELTGYALTTIKRYVKKFKDLLNAARQFFEKPLRDIIVILCDNLGREKTEKCYLFKFYGENNTLLFSKIGTTTRSPMARLKEEIKGYRRSRFLINKVEVCAVIDCGNIPAEGAESILRATFIKQFPNSFKKNDRFFGVDIPTETFKNIVEGYLS
jgi:hypothetical protein